MNPMLQQTQTRGETGQSTKRPGNILSSAVQLLPDFMDCSAATQLADRIIARMSKGEGIPLKVAADCVYTLCINKSFSHLVYVVLKQQAYSCCRKSLAKQKEIKKCMCLSCQYAFLVTSVVQFAGGVVVFFGLLTSPKEVGEFQKEAEPSSLSVHVLYNLSISISIYIHTVNTCIHYIYIPADNPWVG